MLKIIFGSLTIFCIGAFMLTSCSSMGTRPGKKDFEIYSYSKNFDPEKKIFFNRRPYLIEKMKKENFSLSLVLDWFRGVENARPKKNLPEVKPDFNKITNLDKTQIIWFGHSSFMIKMDQKNLLIDPVFSNYASPVKPLVKRFQRPVVTLEELPHIDIIVISHDHYDHLDMDTVKFFKDKNTKFVVPLGVGRHLRGWGIKDNLIIERDWWQNYRHGELELIATPSQHFSGRNGIKDNETLWASWVIRNKEESLYFSGDSGYDIHFKEIGEKYGPFDIAFIESGQYNEKWGAVHLLPNQFVQTFKDLRAKKYIPIHWGMFELALHSWNEPILFLEKEFLKMPDQLVVPKIGQTIRLDEKLKFDRWWL